VNERTQSRFRTLGRVGQKVFFRTNPIPRSAVLEKTPALRSSYQKNVGSLGQWY